MDFPPYPPPILDQTSNHDEIKVRIPEVGKWTQLVVGPPPAGADFFWKL